ncbi:MAG: hypothetical protein DU429_08465 [Candidatus Tokpelaia sp.]|nr:MAG: hypothetical protein DU429_08465 [Candidatus Tokpelaia sp.]
MLWPAKTGRNLPLPLQCRPEQALLWRPLIGFCLLRQSNNSGNFRWRAVHTPPARSAKALPPVSCNRAILFSSGLPGVKTAEYKAGPRIKTPAAVPLGDFL